MPVKIPPPINMRTGEPSWRWRRIMLFVVIAFCMMVILRLIDKSDTGLNGTIATGMVWLIGVIALIYSGFATVQDVVAIITTRTGRPYADPPAAPVPPPVQADTIVVNNPPSGPPAGPQPPGQLE